MPVEKPADPIALNKRPGNCEKPANQSSLRRDRAVDRRFFHERADDSEVFLGFGAVRHGGNFAWQSDALQDKVVIFEVWLRIPGSALVPSVGFGVLPKRTSSTWTGEQINAPRPAGSQRSSRRRDAFADTQDDCITQNFYCASFLCVRPFTFCRGTACFIPPPPLMPRPPRFSFVSRARRRKSTGRPVHGASSRILPSR